MADSASKSYSTDPALYIYTSLTAGSSHIVTATSRLETILRANRIPFKAIDLATDEKARMLWGRRAGKDESGRVRKIPGLVQMGMVVGDLVEIEDWNEYGELKQHVTIVGQSTTPARPTPAPSTAPTKAPAPEQPKKPEPTPAAEAPKAPEPSKSASDSSPAPINLALRQIGQEAAEKAKDIKKKAAATTSGVGKATPPKEAEKSTPVSDLSIEKGPVEADTILQSPTSTAWRRTPDKLTVTESSQYSTNILESLQSPTSTAWKVKDTERPILGNIESSISAAPAEKTKQADQDQGTPEEDEDEDDDEEDEDDDDEEEEEEEEEEDEQKGEPDSKDEEKK